MARTINISDEERERRRKAANEMVAQGKIGGPRPGSGRPRKKRLTEVVNEELQTSGKDIADTIKRNMEPTARAEVQLSAARLAMEVSEKEDKILREEEGGFEKLSREELTAGVADMLTGLVEAGVDLNVLGSLPTTAEEITDAEVIDSVSTKTDGGGEEQPDADQGFAA